MGMTNEEARAYFIKCNKDIISTAKDENMYNYETQQIEYVFMKRDFEANELAIKALESQRWIPVSERLPEDYIHVLCQFTLGGMGECYLAHGAFHVVGGLVMTCNEVIAWMPLPTSYQGEENG